MVLVLTVKHLCFQDVVCVHAVVDMAACVHLSVGCDPLSLWHECDTLLEFI